MGYMFPQKLPNAMGNQYMMKTSGSNIHDDEWVIVAVAKDIQFGTRYQLQTSS